MIKKIKLFMSVVQIICGYFVISIEENTLDYLKNSTLPFINDRKKITAIEFNLHNFDDYEYSLRRNKRKIILNEIKRIFPKLEDITDSKNLGGDSIVSEAISSMISMILFDIGEIIPEIKIEYTNYNTSKADHMFTCIRSKSWSLVSTTRVYNNLLYDLDKFLYRKLCGLCYARDNLSQIYQEQIYRGQFININLFLHIFCKNAESANKIRNSIIKIRKGFYGYDSCNLYDINILVIVSNISEIFHNHNEGFEHIDVPNLDKSLNRFGFGINENNQLYRQKFNRINLSVDDINDIIDEFHNIYKQHIVGRVIEVPINDCFGNKIAIKHERVFSVPTSHLKKQNKMFAKSMNVTAQMYNNINKIIDDIDLSKEQGMRFGLVSNLTKLSEEISNAIQKKSDSLINNIINY